MAILRVVPTIGHFHFAIDASSNSFCGIVVRSADGARVERSPQEVIVALRALHRLYSFGSTQSSLAVAKEVNRRVTNGSITAHRAVQKFKYKSVLGSSSLDEFIAGELPDIFGIERRPIEYLTGIGVEYSLFRVAGSDGSGTTNPKVVGLAV